jgi:hypothetical protein
VGKSVSVGSDATKLVAFGTLCGNEVAKQGSVVATLPNLASISDVCCPLELFIDLIEKIKRPRNGDNSVHIALAGVI